MRHRGVLLHQLGWSGCAAPVVASSPSASASRAAGRALRRLLVASMCAVALVGCLPAGAEMPTVSPVAGREDLTVMAYPAHVSGGLSEPVAIDVPAGVSAALIEVAGERGQFHLAELTTPSGRDLVESGGFVTRDAREVDGLVDWLYPNSPSLAMESGRHVLRFTALAAGGGVIDDEDVTVRLYARTGEAAGGALKLDVLFADDAVDPGPGGGSTDDIAAALVGRIARLYAQAGLTIADYTTATVALGGSDFALAGGRLATASLVDVQTALRAAGARADAVHLVVVHALDDGGADVAGYSLGLPGPFAANRPTAAVLVSAAPFAGPGGVDSDEMAVTCAHEIGHYLGLYHTSERDGGAHDPIADTPECGGGDDACPDGDNVMFWTGGGARHVLTAGQGAVMRRHPLVVAAAPPAPAAASCASACNAGDTCVVLAGTSECATACDPVAQPCTSGHCALSDDNTWVCRAD